MIRRLTLPQYRTLCQSITLLLLLTGRLHAQSWQVTGAIPTGGRYDDISFVTPDLGWACGGSGRIIKTEDGGATWQIQVDGFAEYFRTIDFLDAYTGFAGTLDGSLFHTLDGGDTWTNIRDRIPVTVTGICGLSHAGHHVFGTGTWSYPAFFIKSADRGATWTHRDMSAFADGLVECHFMDSLIGFVTGIRDGGVILKTEDGGETWQEVYHGQDGMEYVWKLFFVNDSVGYGSIESFAEETSIVKTTDGGNTWGEWMVSPLHLDIQGIGFISEMHGWVSPRQETVFETIDGGITWHPQYLPLSRVNRYIRVQDSLLYASGHSIYKFADGTSSLAVSGDPDYHQLLSAFPNPFSNTLDLRLRLDTRTYVRLDIITVDGHHTIPLFAGRMEADIHDLHFSDQDLTRVPAGHYVLVIRTNEGFLTHPLVRMTD